MRALACVALCVAAALWVLNWLVARLVVLALTLMVWSA
jgi:hypothetical protein